MAEYELTCGLCGISFVRDEKRFRFCSNKCAQTSRKKFTNCKQCGVKFHINRNGKQLCSRKCASIQHRVALEKRFFSKVEQGGKDECWLWVGSRRSDTGYGQIWNAGKMNKASRISYLLAFGPIPNGLHVLHRCDNPPCVNPHHLFLGTHRDNMDDKHRKQRCPIGSDVPASKLTDEKVVELRKRFKPGTDSYLTLAREYGISTRVLYTIVNRKGWKHV